MSKKPQTNAALLRKVARLEAQLKAAQDLNLRISSSDMRTVMQNADLKLRIEQAAALLAGGDE